MTHERPNPDDLLSRVQAEGTASHRGKLKIFFGYAAGVGKTYSMLEAARRDKASGVDIVVGYVEPHGRRETESLLVGLEILPVRQFEYHGMSLRELDVNAALARKPELILVDELAHTNAEGSRHAKRWQDVEELLEAGIDVYTTLNVQHIESLNDVVAGVTGVTVRETIPDHVFESADDLELVDLTPEELLERLQTGKVYVSTQAERALQSFFQKSNLVALRELSLRRAAQRVHEDVEEARRAKSPTRPWATAERLLVCVGPSPTTARVIRTAKRMATALDAEWLAVSVDTDSAARSNSVASEQTHQHMRLAERLGAETLTLTGQDVALTILEYARTHNVTKVFLGKTLQSRWKQFLWRSVVDELLDHSGDIDVYVIHGELAPMQPRPAQSVTLHTDWWNYLATVGVIAGSGLIAALFSAMRLSEANLVMVFLAAVAFVAFRFGRRPAILASVGAVLTFDFFFVPPYLSFGVEDTQYVLTFAVMLVIGLVISTLTSRLKHQAENARVRERRSAALFQLGRQLSSVSGSVFLVAAAGRQIAEMFEAEVVIYLKDAAGHVELMFGDRPDDSRPEDLHDKSIEVARTDRKLLNPMNSKSPIAAQPINPVVAQWVTEHDQMAGTGTDTLPNATALFVPLTASQQTVGAIGVRVPDAAWLLQPDQRRLLEACAHQLALAIERDQMAIAASEARVQAEAEQLRSALLSGVSHDLRTPLAAIAGASSSLLRDSSMDDATRRELLETIQNESHRLGRLLENLLEMSRLESGASSPRQQWQVLEEIVGSALHRARRELEQHIVEVRLPADLPLVFVDDLLLEQVFVNLFENAARYTPPGSTITIAAHRDDKWLEISVVDNGPGLIAGTEERLFEKFYRGPGTPDGRRGSGLGLAICRAVARVHGGNIRASNRPGGGAAFTLRLPLPDNVPQVVVE